MADGITMVPGWEGRVGAILFVHQGRLAGDIERDVAADIAAHHTDTGDLHRSVHRKASHPNRVYIGTDHWIYIEYRVKPHWITPRTKRVLTNRATFYGTRVKHPGSRAQRPMRRALRKKRALRG